MLQLRRLLTIKQTVKQLLAGVHCQGWGRKDYAQA
jgi:hypothetical protein